MRVNNTSGLSPEELAATMEIADFAKMEEIRARVDSIVDDPATAEALKPWYRQFCKRPCFHDEYLQAFNQPNVTLVDTHGQGVERITERGAVVDGVEYELDCLIFATGLRGGHRLRPPRRLPLHRQGRPRRLTEKWADGVRTLHGMHVNGFPNCFVLGITQAGFTVNFPYLFDIQAQHAACILAGHSTNDVATFEASEAAEAAGSHTIVARGGATSVDTASSSARPATTTTRARRRTHPAGRLLLRHPDRIRRAAHRPGAPAGTAEGLEVRPLVIRWYVEPSMPSRTDRSNCSR